MNFLTVIATLLFSLFTHAFVNDTAYLIRPKATIQTPKQIGYEETLKLFLKAERKLMHYRFQREKNRTFSDPIAEYEIWLSTFKKQSPALLEHTNIYTNSLLKILQNDKIQKNKDFNDDIIMLFYALCIDDYTDTINKIFELYKSNQVDKETLKFVIIQDCFFSNLVISNYQHPKLKLLLNKILKEVESTQISSKVNLAQEIKEIISGKVWNECKNDYTTFQPVILKSKDCQ